MTIDISTPIAVSKPTAEMMPRNVEVTPSRPRIGLLLTQSVEATVSTAKAIIAAIAMTNMGTMLMPFDMNSSSSE